MNPLQTILFATDFSPNADIALSHAGALAAAHGATLHVLHVRELLADDPYHPAHHFPEQEAYEAMVEKLNAENMGKVQASPQIKLVKETRRALSAAPEIVAYAEAIGAGIVVTGTHGRRGLSHVLLGSVAEQVIRLARTPVLTVVRDTPPASPAYQKIVVASDLAERSRHAAQIALALALAGPNAHISFIHVIDDVARPTYDMLGKGSITEIFPQLEDRCLKSLRELAADVAADSQHQATVAVGRPHQEIVKHAQAVAADLLVVGHHNYSAMEQVLIGSVANKVLRTAACPVLTVGSAAASNR